MQLSKTPTRLAARIALLPVLALTLPALVQGGIGAAQAASSEIVHLDTQSGTKHVHIIRGNAIQSRPVSGDMGSREQAQYQPLQGMNGWFVDNENGRLGNCFRQRTGQYRGWRVQCVWKDLP